MKQENGLDQKNQQSDLPTDHELKRLLAKWPALEPPGDLDRRTYKSYRTHFDRRGRLSRLMTGSIRIPFPIVVAAILSICVTSFLAARKGTGVSVEAPPPPLTKYVEVPVPVIQEKLVMRVVHRKEGQRSSKPISPIPERGVSTAARRDLANFRPVDEINIVVISGEKHHDK